MENNIKEIGLYIHIPFCKSKCYYCDFFSISNLDEMKQSYIECVKKEIIYYGTKNKYVVKTIYIGGGTPSSLDENYISDIMHTIKDNFKLSENAEITIEVNPGTVNKKKLKTYLNTGINRLSIGLQSTKNEILKSIGRIHTFEQFLQTYKDARNIGFKNINVDLMIGLPEQKLSDVKESLEEIIKLNPEHISVYSLILEEGTRLYNKVINNEVTMISDDLERDMYWYVSNTLKNNNFVQYEISNFSKKRYESKHNMDCWGQNEYIGIGAGASSFINEKRFSNIKDIKKYILNISENNYKNNLILEETLDNESKMNEYMMLGLRKLKGINIKDFEEKFNVNPLIKYCSDLEKLNKDNLIIVSDEYIRLTNKGIDFANLVWQHFV